MSNREVNYPQILPQEQPPKHLSLSCNANVKIDVNVYNTATRNDINSWKVITASSAHLTNIWEGKSPVDQYPFGIWKHNSIT